jgi:hypothetical protein
MYDIPMVTPTPEFGECWQAAGRRLQVAAKAAGVRINWMKADLKPFFMEHLSFALGNQLFFVRLEDAAGGFEDPSTLDLLNFAPKVIGGMPSS